MKRAIEKATRNLQKRAGRGGGARAGAPPGPPASPAISGESRLCRVRACRCCVAAIGPGPV
ncbi:hypothetical protein NCPPB3923_24830 [Burkholderia glumae]|nr:hypothetical protein NCPPB3923_24830 [Burkholderia glumae]